MLLNTGTINKKGFFVMNGKGPNAPLKMEDEWNDAHFKSFIIYPLIN